MTLRIAHWSVWCAIPHETTPSLPAPNKPSGYDGVGHETNVANELAPVAVPVPEPGRATSQTFVGLPDASCADADPPSIVCACSESVASTSTDQDVTLRSKTPMRNVPPSTSIAVEAPVVKAKVPSGLLDPVDEEPNHSLVVLDLPVVAKIVTEDHEVAAVVQPCVQPVAHECLLRSRRRWRIVLRDERHVALLAAASRPRSRQRCRGPASSRSSAGLGATRRRPRA